MDKICYNNSIKGKISLLTYQRANKTSPLIFVTINIAIKQGAQT